MRTIRVAVVLALVAIMLAAAGGDEKYQVCLSRPSKVGEQYAVVSKGSRAMKTSVIDQGNATDIGGMEVSADYAATVTVVSVDDRGETTKGSHRITKFTATLPQGASEVLSAGTEMVVEVVGDHREFTVDGKPLPAGAEDFVTLVIPRSYSAKTDDDMFGTSEAKKIGESWPVNKAAMAADMRKDALNVAEDDITGEVTLEEVREHWGVPCLYVTSSMEIKGMAPPLPPGLTLESCVTKMSFTSLRPVDTTLPNDDSTADMQVVVTAKGRQSPDSPEVTVTMTVSDKHKETREPVK